MKTISKNNTVELDHIKLEVRVGNEITIAPISKHQSTDMDETGDFSRVFPSFKLDSKMTPKQNADVAVQKVSKGWNLHLNDSQAATLHTELVEIFERIAGGTGAKRA